MQGEIVSDPSPLPAATRGWKDVVCPLGGPHEWEYLTKANAAAGAVTGVTGCLACLFCWPALFCLPLIFLGANEVVKETSDRKCMRCGMVITYQGVMKTPPYGVPNINPGTGKNNSDYGYGLMKRETPPGDADVVPTAEPQLPEIAQKKR